MRSFSKHDLNLVLVSVIWGANYGITKMALGQVTPTVFAALRFLVSTGLLWIVVLGLKQHGPMPRRSMVKLLGWGVVGHTLNQVCFLWGLRMTTATNSAVIFANMPLAVAMLGIALGIERPRPRVWVGIGLGVVGVAIVVGANGFHFSRETLAGDLLNVGALAFWAVFTVGVRQTALGHNSAQVTALTHLGGTPGLLAAATPALVGGPPIASLAPVVWLGVLYSSLLSSVVAGVLWTRSLKALGGNRTALYNCVTPVFASLFAWALLGERPVPLQAVGAALVVAAVLVSRAPAEEVES
ncbi:MAG: DMT family transporter [Gemmatimonadetes bacterium]|nr:DMT family transporter [Gemmatimonadota bacterium]